MARILLEVCVDSPAGLAEAVAGGADRVELCSALDLGGLTPSPGLMAAAARGPVPVMAMIRPRGGDFVWSPDDVAVMRADILAARQAGLRGVVIGASLPDGRLDRALLADLAGAAAGMDLTLHRAFDLVPDRDAGLEMAVDLGFRRILTSGGASTAPEGVSALARLMRRAAGRITIMPAAGIGAETAAMLCAALPGLTEAHASCARAHPVAPALRDLGFSGPVLRQTSRTAVQRLRAALDAATGHG